MCFCLGHSNSGHSSIVQFRINFCHGNYFYEWRATLVLRQNMWLYVAVCGYMWLYVAVCGYMWLYVVICGYMWLYVVICGCMWLYVVICGYAWLYVVICGYMWLCVVICGYIDSVDKIHLVSLMRAFWRLSTRKLVINWMSLGWCMDLVVL